VSLLVRVRLAACLIVGALAPLGSTAGAQQRRAAADIRAVIPGASLAASTLVGRSGQLYLPQKQGGWKREGRGGIACDIRGAFRLSGALWAACSRAPMFARDKGMWSARPLPNRGRTRVAWAGGDPIVSVGRHIYTWRGDWKRRSSSPGRIKSLHAETASQLVAVTTRRQLIRSSGNNWSVVVDAPGRRDKNADPPERVFGSTSASYAISEKGVIAEVDRSRLKPLSLPAGVSSIEVGATVGLPGGEVLAAAVLVKGGQRRRTLLRFRGPAIETDTGPTLSASERVTLLYVQGADTLLATNRGRVFVRDASGAWTAQTIDNQLPAPVARPTANSGPAKSDARAPQFKRQFK
jgi:hypothetical protein